MESFKQYLLLAAVILLSALVLAALTWVNYRFAVQDTGVNTFLPNWAGARLFLLRGWSPYSQQTTDEIQKLVSGDEDQPVKSTTSFILPIYSLLVFSPFALIDDPIIARSVWMTLLELSLVGILGIGVRLLNWRPSWWMLLVLLLFVFTWYFNLRVLLQGDVVILCVLFISVTLLAIQSQNDGLAGFMLAMASIQFRLVLLFLPLILVWAVLRRRWILFFSPIASLAILVAASSLFISDWVIQFVRQLVTYANFGLTPGQTITFWYPGVGKQFGWGLTIFLGSMLVWELKEMMKLDDRGFLWLAFLTLVATNLIGFGISLKNYVILLPAMLPILSTWDSRWKGLGKALNGVILLLFSLGIWFLSINGSRQAIPPELNLGLVFLAPLIILIGLYWVRRWAIKQNGITLNIMTEM